MDRPVVCICLSATLCLSRFTGCLDKLWRSCPGPADHTATNLGSLTQAPLTLRVCALYLQGLSTVWSSIRVAMNICSLWAAMLIRDLQKFWGYVASGGADPQCMWRLMFVEADPASFRQPVNRGACTQRVLEADSLNLISVFKMEP